MKANKYILTEISDSEMLGGKAGSLAMLTKKGFNVPKWFVVSPLVLFDSLSLEQLNAFQENDFSKVKSIIHGFVFFDEFKESLKEAIGNLSTEEDAYFAVRSSALEEDGQKNSYAGQFESYLFVKEKDIEKRIIDVWNSAFNPRVMTYCKENGIENLPSIPAALIQIMIPAEKAGVAFSADPISGRSTICTVSAVYGVGNSLVSGEAEADTYYVDRENNITDRIVKTKNVMQVLENGKLTTKEVSEEINLKSVLDDKEIIEAAVLARETSKVFGCFQDIEWAYYNDKLYLLQSRPITSMGKIPDKDGFLNLWDNSNIVESYGGITTPMTFSFIRRAYEEVYRQMCLIFGVSQQVVDENSNTFKRMLGLIKGRVYYNLLSWYKVIAILPGFKFNRKFMEQMMGVKEGIPDELVKDFNITEGSRLLDFLNFNKAIIGFGHSFITLDKRIDKFYKRLRVVLAPKDFSSMRLDELVSSYRELERSLLTKWDAPLINDFFAMIFYGIHRKVSEKWFISEDKNLYNDLLCGQGDIISAEPAKRIREMAEIILENKELIKILIQDESYIILREIEKIPGLKMKYSEYLNLFGNRCLNELKLESPTLLDEPLPLLRSIGYLAERLDRMGNSRGEQNDEMIRIQAEKVVKRQLAWKPFKRLLFAWILKNTRKVIRNRENLRFERTRLFGTVRLIVLEIGKRMASYHELDNYRDVFYLEIEEILNFVEGIATTKNLKELTELRKEEYKGYETEIAPDDRFETRGAVNIGNSFKNGSLSAVESDTNGEVLRGLGCCPGVVEGKVRIIKNPKGIKLNKDEIIVAETTDPGWIMLFPSAAGILVERGSLLSHSAIVARELGIPAIVSLTGLTKWLNTGDYVKFDGATGIVTKIVKEKANEPNA
ncbi:MAG: PEP/pyruvate-binding domain-containing protein [Ignavibacteriales bacterium]